MFRTPLLFSLTLVVVTVIAALSVLSPSQSRQVTLAQINPASTIPDSAAIDPPYHHPLVRVTARSRVTRHVRHKIVNRIVRTTVAAITPTPIPATTITHTYATPTPTPTPTPTLTPTHTVVSAASGASRAVAFALAQIGKPYLWGGTGPDGFDCSGLTSSAWAYAGVTIPRTSYAQWSGLTNVSISSLIPGDILVFSGAGHVGLYVGSGFMVDAPEQGRPVEKVSLEGYWNSHLIGAVRP